MADLLQDHVLMQAWKKAASHIRNHNWYSDTLELDMVASDLPAFLHDLRLRIEDPERWRSDPLRMVPAPKPQEWTVRGDGRGVWEPKRPRSTAAKLRPLARVSLRDQVAAVALLLCLADQVETRQLDPTGEYLGLSGQRRVVSYGNRLFCDGANGSLSHRWGSVKLYRSYYEDYRAFLARPEASADRALPGPGQEVVVAQFDLKQFYDRVTPALMWSKLAALRSSDSELAFLEFAKRVLTWEWDGRDGEDVRQYASATGLSDFRSVALPQGLVAAGFFANVILLDFDDAVRASMDTEVRTGVGLLDACRYVDDLRLVLSAPEGAQSEVLAAVTGWLESMLNTHCAGLSVNQDKTILRTYETNQRPLVLQSRRMARIQAAVSGGFDIVAGQEILDAVHGLVQSQLRYSEGRVRDLEWPLAPIPDVRDDTVARFAAARFRRTYRSLRPLMDAAVPSDARPSGPQVGGDEARARRNRAELDSEAKTFALGLIEAWVADPSNVRLLRIGLDIWPDADVLDQVLSLLRPFTERGGRRKAPRRVAWYCLAEIFRAGATETGLVADDDELPSSLDVAEYHRRLLEEAGRLSSLPRNALPWYLRQQILLYYAAKSPDEAPVARSGKSAETQHYRRLIQFLRRDPHVAPARDFAVLYVVARRCFGWRSLSALTNALSPTEFAEVASRDPGLAAELVAANPKLARSASPRLREDLCIKSEDLQLGWQTLGRVVLQGVPTDPLRTERGLLQFSIGFLTALRSKRTLPVVTPDNVHVLLPSETPFSWSDLGISIAPSRVSAAGSIYAAPAWCGPEEAWRFQLGFLLRFILVGNVDFTQNRPIRRASAGSRYVAASSHWYQRVHGFYSGHSAYGDPWLPVSEWIERFVGALLMWPGCRPSEMSERIAPGTDSALELLHGRIRELEGLEGPSGRLPVLPLRAGWPTRRGEPRPLRACILQTAVPSVDDFSQGDVTMSGPEVRKRHRRHLAAALAAVERMLDLRETHRGRAGRLDWLVLPELSVHPDDIETHLFSFARAHRTIVLAGVTYQRPPAHVAAANSAVWIIPQWSVANGLQIVTRRQGKQHLAPAELKLNVAAGTTIGGYRPCQWLVEYPWSSDDSDPLLRLTAAICYDATDLSLAADLRSRSDVLAIPALNKDVTTFDQMALALHYHMFQMVVVANSGCYGGSNAYAPFRERYTSQVFHLHGQPQASAAFFEIDDIAEFLRRAQAEGAASGLWKSPPAGL